MAHNILLTNNTEVTNEIKNNENTTILSLFNIGWIVFGCNSIATMVSLWY